MNWQTFLTEWSDQNHQDISLYLSGKLTEDELSALLRVCPDFLEDNTYEAAGSGYASRSTIRDNIAKICEKCSIHGFSNNKDELLKRLRKKFYQIPALASSESTFSENIVINTNALSDLGFPEGFVPIGSKFYMSCDQEFQLSINAIAKPRGFVRIKSPRQMGKTSLLERILADSNQKGFRTVKVDLRAIDERSLESLNDFLKWFCQQIVFKLKLPIVVSNEWRENEAANVNCSDFFENYLLGNNHATLLVSIDNLDVIFDYPSIADEFLGLLRTWLEDSSLLWKDLRMIIVHTCHYNSKKLNRSPLSMGKEVNMPCLTFSQVKTLANLHQLNLNEESIHGLANFVNYHPYLIRLMLYELAVNGNELSFLLNNTLANGSIYSNFLQRHRDYLFSEQSLVDLMTKIVADDQGLDDRLANVDLSSTKLQALGLVEYSDYKLKPKNQLFKIYFSQLLKDE